MNVMLLAAGLGARLKPFTNEIPKPAIPFLTTPLAAFSLSLIEKIKVHNLVVNTHYLPKQIERLFNCLRLPTKDLFFTFEKELLGSGGGIHNAEAALSGRGSILVMNADEIILPHRLGAIEDMLSFHQWHKGIATLLVMKHPEVGKKFGGVWVERVEGVEGVEGQDKVSLFSKTNPGGNLQGYHFIGAMLLSEHVFKYFKSPVQDENILYETLTKAMAAGEEVRIFEIDCDWFEIGNPQDFLSATKTCLDILSHPNEDIRYQYLSQTLRLYGEGKTFIENNDENLLDQMKNIFARNFIRFS